LFSEVLSIPAGKCLYTVDPGFRTFSIVTGTPSTGFSNTSPDSLQDRNGHHHFSPRLPKTNHCPFQRLLRHQYFIFLGVFLHFILSLSYTCPQSHPKFFGIWQVDLREG